MKFQILVDSSCDMLAENFKNSEIGFKVIPLTIYVGDKEFVDDENLNVEELISAMNSFKGKMSSACPAPEAFLEQMGNADYTFVVTMTAKLSGTYNSACVARDMYEKPENVYVFNTKSTAGSMELVVEEIVRQIEQEQSFTQIVENVEKFIKNKHLFFILHKFDNLIANGRMSKFAGFMAKTLVIKPICSASPEGTIDIVNKCVGSLNAYKKMVDLMGQRCNDFGDRKLIISHCNNEEDAKKIETLVKGKLGFKQIIIKAMRGLTSFYAQEKGLILCY